MSHKQVLYNWQGTQGFRGPVSYEGFRVQGLVSCEPQKSNVQGFMGYYPILQKNCLSSTTALELGQNSNPILQLSRKWNSMVQIMEVVSLSTWKMASYYFTTWGDRLRIMIVCAITVATMVLSMLSGGVTC